MRSIKLSLVLPFLLACGSQARPAESPESQPTSQGDEATESASATESTAETADSYDPGAAAPAAAAPAARSGDAAPFQGPWVTSSDALGFHVINLLEVGEGVGCVGMDRSVHGSRVASLDARAGSLRIWIRPERVAEAAPTPPPNAPCPSAFAAEGRGDGVVPASVPTMLECTRDDLDLACSHQGGTVRFRSLSGQLDTGAARLLASEWWDLGQSVRTLLDCGRGCEEPRSRYSLQSSPGGGVVFGTAANLLRFLGANPQASVEAGGRLQFLEER